MENNFSMTNCVHVQDAIDQYRVKLNQTADWTTFLSVKIFFGLINAAIFIVGLGANAGVLYTVLNSKKHRTARNILLLNMSLADLLLCITSVLVTPFVAIGKTWRFGSGLCQFIPFAQSTSILVMSWSLMAITVDRYVHIVHIARAPLRLRRAILIVVSIWLFGFGINIPFALSHRITEMDVGISLCGDFCEEIDWPLPNYRKIYGMTVAAFQLFIPTITMTYCYSRIFIKVRQDMIVKNEQFSQALSTKQSKEAGRRQRKVNGVLVGMVVAFVLPWMPLIVLNILRDHKIATSSQPYFAWLSVHSWAMTNIIWNPLLFFWLAQASRRKKKEEAEMTFLGTMDPENRAKSSLQGSRAPYVRGTRREQAMRRCMSNMQLLPANSNGRRETLGSMTDRPVWVRAKPQGLFETIQTSVSQEELGTTI